MIAITTRLTLFRAGFLQILNNTVSLLVEEGTPRKGLNKQGCGRSSTLGRNRWATMPTSQNASVCQHQHFYLSTNRWSCLRREAEAYRAYQPDGRALLSSGPRQSDRTFTQTLYRCLRAYASSA